MILKSFPQQLPCFPQFLGELVLLLLLLVVCTESAVRPPPWADPELNPCASQPGGWQYIFWHGKCHKIFQIGYPCPETMELVPSGTRNPRGVMAECRCPPSSAFYKPNRECYELFQRGPCQRGQFLAPQKEATIDKETKVRVGYCKNMEPCQKSNYIFWPLEGKCYKKHSRGPCPRGQLLNLNSDGISICACSKDNEMNKYFWEPSNSCYEHYTKGPCQEEGHLFLPERVCDCHDKLPHYHEDSGQCYELESRGPCKRGHEFTLIANSSQATCKCKSDHIMWLENGNCYRPYTQGPCPLGQIILNSTTCMAIPCGRGYLYFPAQQTCYRIGSQGPCPTGQVVTFDFRTRPSIDGISYNGICGCTGLFNENNNCLKEKRSTKNCDVGLVSYKNKCYKLYTQGPCLNGQWLVPNRQGKVQLWQENVSKNLAKCDCRPGYTSYVGSDKKIKCLPPSVSIANYLNKYYVKEI